MTTKQECPADWGFSYRETNRAKTFNEDFGGADPMTTEPTPRQESDGVVRLRNATARSEAARDQIWEALKGAFSDIKRIANDGPDGSESDGHLISSVCHCVCGELLMRRSQALAAAKELTR